jgi:archaeosine-15-forming tRNA-guanine transglycosylase
MYIQPYLLHKQIRSAQTYVTCKIEEEEVKDQGKELPAKNIFLIVKPEK